MSTHFYWHTRELSAQQIFQKTDRTIYNYTSYTIRKPKHLKQWRWKYTRDRDSALLFFELPPPLVFFELFGEMLPPLVFELFCEMLPLLLLCNIKPPPLSTVPLLLCCELVLERFCELPLLLLFCTTGPLLLLLLRGCGPLLLLLLLLLIFLWTNCDNPALMDWIETTTYQTTTLAHMTRQLPNSEACARALLSDFVSQMKANLKQHTCLCGALGRNYAVWHLHSLARQNLIATHELTSEIQRYNNYVAVCASHGRNQEKRSDDQAVV